MIGRGESIYATPKYYIGNYATPIDVLYILDLDESGGSLLKILVTCVFQFSWHWMFTSRYFTDLTVSRTWPWMIYECFTFFLVCDVLNLALFG